MSGTLAGLTIESVQGLDNQSHSSPLVPAGGNTTLDYLFPSGSLNGFAHFNYGWLVIYDPNGSISDLIHFDSSYHGSAYPNPSYGYDQMFFYSNDTGDLADNWVTPSVLAAILASNPATTTENAAGIAYYTPGSSSSPGAIIGGGSYQYEFISDVPDGASTVSLLGAACGSLALFGRRLRK